MKPKYTALVLLAVMAGATAFAVRAGSTADAQARPRKAGAETHVAQLDKRLQERVEEQQELLGIIERILQMQQGARASDAAGSRVLSGAARPPAAPVAAPPVQRTPPPPAAAWWNDYKAQMVYLSGGDRYAVVNGKMVTRGQAVAEGVVVEQIDDDRVVLRRGTEHHTYVLKK